ncbi:protein translocase subunit SecF [Candidatus Parcubacteria bacterium]|nr:protein translocase subunit SecF [Patescibacteria group bacterium]MBU4482204.1 protein translocase subunit SecF [Patescibacteria group bacterium]MCG2686599.1 protein translocase subunit SecF [Candidatus Parcubacteria bacterium]
MSLKIIHNRNKFFIASGILVLLSILSLSIWGLNFGIDFTGGSLLEVGVSGEINMSGQDVSNLIIEKMPEIGQVRTQPTNDGFLIRMRDLNEAEHQKILSVLNDGIPSPEARDDILITEKRFESIGPMIGQELKDKALWAILLALIVIIAFIAWTFRKVSKPVASWKYGIGAIIALAHDVIIVTGIFSVLGHFFLGFEVDILFVTALLTILGYSVNDTIVVYDRTRENLIYNPQKTFEDTVNKSVNDTIKRSTNSSLTTLLVLLALYFLGGATIRNFVLALMLGTLVGTYSSIFIASPLLVVWQKMKRR